MNKGKKANVKPFMVKNYLSVFITCMIENPAFDSQVNCPSTPLHAHEIHHAHAVVNLQHNVSLTLHCPCWAAGLSLADCMLSAPGPKTLVL